MTPPHSHVPIVAICNIAEAFYDFLIRVPDSDSHLKGEAYRGDRAIVWIGAAKLVITSLAIPHEPYLKQHAGYTGTRSTRPATNSHLLCKDIANDPAVLAEIVQFAGAGATIQVAPYAATREFYDLVDLLRSDYHLTVLLADTNERDHMWVRDYIDTKAGFRVLTARWLPNAEDLLLEGIVCPNKAEAAQVAHWFINRGQACIVKNDIGENGFGNVIIRPSEFADKAAILDHLNASTVLGVPPLTVEALVANIGTSSPSFEAFVPPIGQGAPYLTYVSDQLFHGFGDFCGVVIGHELTERAWYPTLVESGLRIAQGLQKMGYVGFFDLDAICDADDRIYLLEVNTRRTGGTHTHDFAHFFFGADYLSRVTLLSDDTLSSSGIQDVNLLHEAASALRYPIGDEERGIFITGTSALERDEFGVIIVGRDTADCVALQSTLVATVARFANTQK